MRVGYARVSTGDQILMVICCWSAPAGCSSCCSRQRPSADCHWHRSCTWGCLAPCCWSADTHYSRSCWWVYQYTSVAFGSRCQEEGVVPSLGSRGKCFDNAITESFFATLECELLKRQTLPTHTQARTAIFDYIEGFSNTYRRHSALGYLSPAAFERQVTEEIAA